MKVTSREMEHLKSQVDGNFKVGFEDGALMTHKAILFLQNVLGTLEGLATDRHSRRRQFYLEARPWQLASADHCTRPLR